MAQEKGTISVQTENIFPIIKKFLYSDHEIFLRELISNAVDASQKLQKLASSGELTSEVGDLTISVEINKEQKTISIKDKGLGMTAEEVKKYINQLAFSSAQEFIDQFKGLEDGKQIIGHFGLGFYSAFMVAEKVEIFTQSYKENSEAIKWVCDGSTEFIMEETEKSERGTEIILHIHPDSEEFLENQKINELLHKYCKFLPIPIQFGETETTGENDEKITSPNIINNTQPAWTKKPTELSDEDYKNFYRELYPYAEAPLFWIHLNVDYPFHLTGILYFPRIKKSYEIQKNKIQLYSNQVFVTDEVKEIVPEWLTLLNGVLDSPDIPLNVSRSYLQSDQNVKKINNYITKKIADKLEELFKKDREDFEKKWENISVIMKYGMLTDEKFYERASGFCMLENLDKKYFTFDEYKEFIKPMQTDKSNHVIALYTHAENEQQVFIQAAKERGYDILRTDAVIDNHFISFIEQKLQDVQFKRIDSETIDKLIDKDEKVESVLSSEDQNKIKELFEKIADQNSASIVINPQSPEDLPLTVVKPEFMRRMKEMSYMNGMDFAMNMPDQYQIVINTNHRAIQQLLNLEEIENESKGKHLLDLALLSQNMLTGEALHQFVKRSFSML